MGWTDCHIRRKMAKGKKPFASKKWKKKAKAAGGFAPARRLSREARAQEEFDRAIERRRMGLE